MTGGAWLYILKCADGSYYTGTTRATLELRFAEHNSGHYDGYTAKRLPVSWSTRSGSTLLSTRSQRSVRPKVGRAKKEALIRGDFDALKILAKRRS